MLRWLFDSEERPASEICTCRGDMEVMESCLLKSVTAISRIVGPDSLAVEGDGEDSRGANRSWARLEAGDRMAYLF